MISASVHPAASAGAAWWAQQLDRAVLPPLGRQGSQDEVIAEAVQLINQSTERLTPDGIEAFRGALARRLDACIGDPSGIGTGYQPDAILVDACREAGFSPGLRFPMQTLMWLHPDEVVVSRGRDAQLEVIWRRADD